MTSIIIADDHRMFRESLSKILSMKKLATILAEAANGKELIDLLDTHKPQIILTDISMPEMDGVEATKLAIQKHPDVKVLALSSFGDEKYYYSMLEAGAKGFVLKNAGINELQNAITEIAKGGTWFSADLIQTVISKFNDKQKKEIVSVLTEREIEILRYICESLTNEQISEKINISYDTVKWHRANILSKTECNNTAALVIYAIRNKIFEI